MAVLLIIEGLMWGPSCAAQLVPQMQGRSRRGPPAGPSASESKSGYSEQNWIPHVENKGVVGPGPSGCVAVRNRRKSSISFNSSNRQGTPFFESSHTSPSLGGVLVSLSLALGEPGGPAAAPPSTSMLITDSLPAPKAIDALFAQM